ncbi:P-II family nitrogen regulator [Anaerocolumna xylanovorans]|uniref:Nitrogen regulatory protein P-II family n=1 Tax=Anaerocolumna xylanovorans DSM 12503 TaxID=1121345 RepID=A0A1M7Y0D2_9FIRM|nr:P-II family nitrogen regulator [Anaerocolumna xylanovorans]SHO45040.1 nitrogen regulatory protein P-II family [Anaerocolumna xylanovorans DSM 12503]
MESSDKIKALFIVVNAGYTDTIMDIIRAEGAGGATVINARGEGSHHEMFMGITVDYEKEIILTIVDEATAKRIMMAIKENAGWKSPLHGICFLMPINDIIGIRAGTNEFGE